MLNFALLMKNAASAYINSFNCYELDGDYFDLACYNKAQLADGKRLATVECEHVSYRLNDPDYDKDYFTHTGTPTYILGQILDGTDFTVGTVDFTDSVTYSAQEKKSRRQILMEFVATLEGEVQFDGFEVSILAHRGSATPRDLIVGYHINVVSKTYNKRETDNDGNPLVSYACEVVRNLDPPLALGDEIRIDYDELDIDIALRVVSISYDPYNPQRVKPIIEIGNYINALEDSLYRIATSTVSKDAVYNGCRIGPEYGFEVVLSDNMARSFFNSTAFKMQKGDGSGTNWVDVLYFDPVTQTYVFVGTIAMGAGSTIDWNEVTPPTLEQIGFEGITIDDIADLAGYLTYIGETGIYTGTLVAQQIYGLLLEAVTIKAGKIVGDDENSAILEIGEYGGAIDTAYNEINSIRLKPGGTNCGYLQVIENGEVYFYSNDGSGIDFASIREDGFYLGDLKIAGVVEGEIILTVPQVWVQADEPTEAKVEDLWIDTDDYSRYDKTDISSNTTLEANASEFINASGTFTLTLHAATAAGIIKKVYNTGTGIITIAGTINGATNMKLYPGESVELITDGTNWRY
ncbi:MAG TPA: hypothetical protein VN374_06095 [Desulfitobacteriaceae bacterium]|nr:hypothetical protein [Desulfitobacteriaceae bacterium]